MTRAFPLFAFAIACGRIDFDGRVDADAPADAAARCTRTCIDPTFGIVEISIDGVANGGYGDQGIALQPDGKLVVTGKAATGALVVRLDGSGAFDPSFGGSGYVEIAEPSAQGIAVTVAPNGEIVVAGTSNGTGLIAALDGSGALLRTILPTFGATAVALNGVVVDASERVIAGGQGDVANFDLFAGAWLASGSADPAFTELHYDGGQGDEFGALASRLAPDGGIDLVGQTFNGSNFDGLLIHASNEGAIAWHTATDLGGSERYLAMSRDGAGYLLATGEQDAPTSTVALIERYSSEGALDPTWQTAMLDFGGSDVGRGVLSLGDGRVVVGLRHDSGSRLVVMSATGGLLSVFDLPIARTPNGIDDLIVDAAGRVVVFGDAGEGSADMYVARVLVP